MQERLRSEVAALKLPRGISVDLPKELGSDELTVSLRVRSSDDLGRLVAALNQSSAGLARIIELLCGEPADDVAGQTEGILVTTTTHPLADRVLGAIV